MAELDITPEVLRSLYLDDLLTDTEIAQRYGTYQVKISRLRKKWGISTLDKTGRLTQRLPELTGNQQEVLLGSLLGDGHLFTRSSNETAGFSEGHSMAQSEYTRWKAGVFEPFTLDIYEGEKRSDGKVYKSLSFRTHMCTHFRSWYDLFYPANVKVFPANLHELITPRALAIWYLDDGTLHRKYHPHITFGLDDTSLKRCVRAFKALGLSPELYETKRSMSFCFPSQDKVFFDLIREYVPDCMSYKIPVYSNRKAQDINARKLTPDRASQLYESGMTYADISTLYGVGVSTARRRVLASGSEPRVQGSRKQRYTRREAEVVLGAYQMGKDQWRALPSASQDRLVNEVWDILSKTEFPYDVFEDEKIPGDLRKLQGVDVTLKEQTLPRSWRGTMLCKRFFPNRYKAVSAPSGKSAYEGWFTEGVMKSAIKMQFKYGDPLIPHRVLRAVTAQLRTPTVFRPPVAKALYTRYVPQGGTVWDPCSGYGGRLLGAWASNVRYIGTDVSEDTVQGNRELALKIGFKDAQVHCCPAEDFDCPPVDFVFTSPPYFDREKYAEGVQSWKQYTDLEAWVGGFLSPVIRTARKALSQGRLAINIANLKKRGQVVPLVDETIRVALEEGFELETTLKMPLSNLNRSSPWEPVLVFK